MIDKIVLTALLGAVSSFIAVQLTPRSAMDKIKIVEAGVFIVCTGVFTLLVVTRLLQLIWRGV